jgi:transposase
MLTVGAGTKVFLAAAPVDLRRGHDGLSSLVRNQLALDPFCGHLFVFVGKRGDRVECLFWDRGGFVIYYKRLDEDTFRVPQASHPDATSVEVSERELDALLDGIDVDAPTAKARRPRVH